MKKLDKKVLIITLFIIVSFVAFQLYDDNNKMFVIIGWIISTATGIYAFFNEKENISTKRKKAFDKIIFNLSDNNDATKMNSITELINMIESDQVDEKKAKQISQIVSAHIIEAIKKLLKTPNREVGNFSIPNRLTTAEIEGIRLLSLIYDKFKIRANFKGIDVTGLDFTKITLNGADFTQAVFTNSYFSDSLLADTIFLGAFIRGANFINCHLENSKFYGSIDNDKTSFLGAHLEGADISYFSPKSLCFLGAYIDNETILPPHFYAYNTKNEKNRIERERDYSGGQYND